MQQTKPPSSKSNIPWLYEGLFEWNAYCSSPALPGGRVYKPTHSHCLLRIHLDVVGKKVLVLASELHSNDANISLSLGYFSLAQAITAHFINQLSSVEKIVWLAHFGEFSLAHSYCNIGTPEQFCLVKSLPWPLPEELDKRLDIVPLKKAELESLISEFLPIFWVNQLDAVPDVLLRIDTNATN